MLQILPANRQEKPQVQHLKTRVNFLLKSLRADSLHNTSKRKQASKRNKAREPDAAKGSHKLSKYFPIDETKRHKSKRKATKDLNKDTKRVKRVETKGDSSESEEEEEEEEEEEDDDDDDDDFEDDWKRKKSRRRKTPSNTKPDSTKKRSKTSKGKTETQRKPRATAKRTSKSTSQANGQKSRQKERRRGDRGDRGGGGGGVDECYIVSDYELDEEIFVKVGVLLLKHVFTILIKVQVFIEASQEVSDAAGPYTRR